ncbi:MAG: AMP-binding protein [Treponema sp.]|nr:AMP-binding protein [Treponema sp.]
MAAGIVCLLTGSAVFLKFYPVVISAIFLGVFGYTLFARPTMIFRFATMTDKTIRGSLAEKRVEAYCTKVTIIWCVFFVLNGSVALVTVFSKSDILWSVYNGGISYMLIGLLFAGEYIVRKVVNAKMPKSVPISQFDAKSRPNETILCYERKWTDNKYLTWGDFLRDSAKMRAFIRKHDDTQKWILHCEDYWYFLATFVALLQCGKEILLTANVSPAFIAEIRNEPAIRFLTDMDIADTDFVPTILQESAEPTDAEKMDTPKISADDTKIMMYTSGSTGHPKAVHQRLTEFEMDNAFVISKWGEEFLSRKLCATVSQHHIYGLLFTIMLPFTVAVPFRRKRIELPEEFELLDDENYMIIAVPAFLKRTCAEYTSEKLPLKNPWIFTSGGVLTPEVAKDTDGVFGFWPMEVYGSTETSGIAYRQSKNGLEWTPFDNAKIWKNDDGCLVIISPYIKDPAGFATGDLVEIHDDGRFLLKGRADSIVKIEEKRISVTEVENRLLQSGLVQDVCVVPMSDRRQYLAAAVVLNAEGKAKFADTEKYLINRHFHDYLMQFFENVVLPKKWRYLDAIPMDVQGKKKKPEIQALFAPENPHGIPAELVMYKKDNAVDLEVKIPATSDYFDGHFPEFKLLPAVAQVDLVALFAERYFGLARTIPEIKRFKFTEKILPDTTVVFHLAYDEAKNTVSFKLQDFSAQVTYSIGNYVAQKA